MGLRVFMNGIKISHGEGRTKIRLQGQWLGSDLIIHIYNENAHVGAVAVGEYDPKTRRTSTSVITRLGHKDDVVAQKAAYRISKATKRPVCVIAGIHLDRITMEEISETVVNADKLLDKFISSDFLSQSEK